MGKPLFVASLAFAGMAWAQEEQGAAADGREVMADLLTKPALVGVATVNKTGRCFERGSWRWPCARLCTRRASDSRL